MTSIGKQVFDDLYLHVSAIETVRDEAQKALISAAFKTIPEEKYSAINVVKLNLRSGKISLLEYEPFEESAFPTLLGSWAIEPSSDTPTYRTYRTSLNPPVLHRKELLVAPNYPGREGWLRLTAEAEELGLFENTQTIGFRKNWLQLIESKGFSLTSTGFTPLGNAHEVKESDSDYESESVQRHLTALNRATLSAPVQILIKHGLLSSESSFFDYGCGRGTDMSALKEAGISVGGWDPHYAPENEIQSADVVNLGFVVNVIEDSAERVEAIQKSFALTKKVLAVSVMLYGPEQPGKPFRDGFLTSRNTFQKYFSQGELKDYLEHALGQQVFMAGPGIALVFVDKDAEQQFNARRFRSTDLTERLLAARILRVKATRTPRKRIHRPTKTERQIQEASEVLQKLWTLTLDLGRYPESIEVSFLDELLNKTDRYSRALRLLQTHFDQSLLEVASTERADELLLYLAAQQFEKRPTYRNLEARLQRDIKYFFNAFKSAQSAGLKLIMRAANPSEVLSACDEASEQGLGWLDTNQALHFHISLLDRLPVLLRTYVNCGLIIWDSMSDVHIVKIHIGSGKLTFLEFENFETSPLPLLKRRVKINLRKQEYDEFEYGSAQYPSTVLYNKSRFMHEDMEGYAEQLAFDESLERTSLIDLTTFGPSLDELLNELEKKRLTICGYELSPSESIPLLDEACGANFTYRDFIECGQTQKRLDISNVPLNPKTYNALSKLALEVLDPVVDYFGSIKLTYGFSSSELAKKIDANIAPKLDQHSGHECNKLGHPICERLGVACDFIVEDESMLEVARWLASNTNFDRLYFYGDDRPIHVSAGPENSKQITLMLQSKASNRRIPRSMSIAQFLELDLGHFK
jgi:DNA phosphorothioation-associated putative methyltransferase